jgi:GAF domain-containing protein
MFSRLAAAIASTLDIKMILHTLTAEVSRALDVKGATIRLLNDERTTLRVVASHGLSEKYLDQMEVSSEQSITDALRGIPVMIVDCAADPTVRRKKEKEEEGIISLLSIPIQTRNEVIGILRLYSGRMRIFTQDEIMIVTALANLGGLAIQNAGLYMMVENDLREMKEETWTYKAWF